MALSDFQCEAEKRKFYDFLSVFRSASSLCIDKVVFRYFSVCSMVIDKMIFLNKKKHLRHLMIVFMFPIHTIVSTFDTSLNLITIFSSSYGNTTNLHFQGLKKVQETLAAAPWNCHQLRSFFAISKLLLFSE